jgi:6-pyruvoyltetrahydropterin/6-carboxytetrahydropterin synthase
MGKKYSVTKQIKFAAAHRLMKYDGACFNIHGHNYVAELTFSSERLNPDSDMVIDFKKIKEQIGQWIMEQWDHSIMLNLEDVELSHMAAKNDFKCYLMREGDPTAENMCEELMLLGNFTDQGLTKIRIWETDTSYAELTYSDCCKQGE